MPRSAAWDSEITSLGATLDGGTSKRRPALRADPAGGNAVSPRPPKASGVTSTNGINGVTEVAAEKETEMARIREIAKKIPLLRSTYRALREKREYYRLKAKKPERVFTDIYKGNTWGGKDSRSGPGSDVDQTAVVVETLPVLFNEFKISTMLDIPCGDFHWMKDVDLTNVHYTGADIVEELIQEDTRQYASDRVRFQRLDLIKDSLPKVDLIFCRDCLVHLSFKHILRALENICQSRSGYLLTTTFTAREQNEDIPTGSWRVLNLEVAPFRLPKPLKLIDERCTEGNGIYTDKALGLWKIADIQVRL